MSRVKGLEFRVWAQKGWTKGSLLYLSRVLDILLNKQGAVSIIALVIPKISRVPTEDEMSCSLCMNNPKP